MAPRFLTPDQLRRYDEVGRSLDDLVRLPWQKRMLDVVLSFVLLAVFSPVFAMVFVAMAAEMLLVPSSRGPFFLTEPRGSEGRVFHLPKFRIVRMDVFHAVRATQTHQHIKPMEEDPANLTGVGAVLKKFYLDELPQLVSILKGDMSFVGPRPWPLEPYYDELERGIHRKRLIRPGLTGLVQAHKGNADAPDEWTLDFAYIGFMHSEASGWRKLGLDLRILTRSSGTVAEDKGL